MLEKLQDRCFERSGLQMIRTPANLRKIGNSAFYGCKGLGRIELNEGLEVLGTENYRCYHGVFQESGVQEIVLPSTLREIGGNTFRDCESLRTVYAADEQLVYLSHAGLSDSVRVISS